MAETFYNATEGSGKKFHAWDYVVGANTVLQEFTNPGEYPYATYVVQALAISTATATDHLLTINAGASLKLKVRHILVTQRAAAGAVAAGAIQLVRTITGAPSGGTSITPRRHDTGDGVASFTAMTLPTVKGTESDLMHAESLWLGTGAIPTVPRWEWWQRPGMKPLIIAAGTTNGLALKNLTAIATATVDIELEAVELNY